MQRYHLTPYSFTHVHLSPARLLSCAGRVIEVMTALLVTPHNPRNMYFEDVKNANGESLVITT